jgi:hypothetical protein
MVLLGVEQLLAIDDLHCWWLVGSVCVRMEDGNHYDTWDIIGGAAVLFASKVAVLCRSKKPGLDFHGGGSLYDTTHSITVPS